MIYYTTHTQLTQFVQNNLVVSAWKSLYLSQIQYVEEVRFLCEYNEISESSKSSPAFHFFLHSKFKIQFTLKIQIHTFKHVRK